MKMNEKINGAFNNLSDCYIDEALDFKAGRMPRKKATAVLIAAALMIAVAIIPVGAKGLVDGRRIKIFEPQNAVMVYDNIITITPEQAGPNTVSFSVTSSDPQYSELYIYSYRLKGYYGGATTPYYGNYGKMSGTYEGSGLKVEESMRDLVLYLEKQPSEGRLLPEREYTLIIEGIAAKKPDGSIAELQGDWKVKFRF